LGGFFCGALLGALLVALPQRWLDSSVTQWLAALLAASVLAGAWVWAARTYVL
jgi:hypothetical protein